MFVVVVFTRGGCISYLHACLGVMLLPQSYQYPNLSKGADRVGGQLRGDKECSFSGITNSGRVWRKVSQSDARSVPLQLYPFILFTYILRVGARFCSFKIVGIRLAEKGDVTVS